ncbi:MAG: cysteine--tRNA ligase [Gammaproteobacteria bacterium]|nr:cysteine--tRNA ligase [Gammaproteobacteria bacterium]
MNLKIYNTLSREKELFVPLNPKSIKMYVCGPTVYSYAHIGNARPAVIFDTLYRVLKNIYPEVIYVRNITDVDDKINEAAKKLNKPISFITKKYTDIYHQDMQSLNVLSPSHEPRVTDNIEQIISMIQRIIDNKKAYIKDSHILFDVTSFERYGELSNRDIDEMLSGARVEVAEYKKNPGDFVLWKPSKDDEPGWDSPWGYGRPGWHIECSSMVETYLGKEIDIHGGGQDLIFPHHENEIAQSCSAHNSKSYAKYWMHNGYLNMEGEKMSKSLGNIITVKELLEKYDGEVIRLALLSTHYRKPINFGESLLEQSKNILNKLYKNINNQSYEDVVSKDVINSLLDDLNTPLAIASLLKIKCSKTLIKSANLLGLLNRTQEEWLSSNIKSTISENDIELLINERDEARKAKDFVKADEIRDQLEQNNVILEDIDGKTIWRVKK